MNRYLKSADYRIFLETGAEFSPVYKEWNGEDENGIIWSVPSQQVPRLETLSYEDNRILQLEILSVEFANNAHRGQKRRNGDPYVSHPFRLASRWKRGTDVSDWRLRILARIHDTWENGPDNGFPVDRVILSNLFPGDIVWALDALTRRKDESYLDYIIRARQNPLALPVKNADLEDNMSDLKPGNMLDKYLMAKYILHENGERFGRP